MKDNAYKSGIRTVVVQPGKIQVLALDLKQSHLWYDLSLTINGADRFLRRFAGRVETGNAGFSDPAMGHV